MGLQHITLIGNCGLTQKTMIADFCYLEARKAPPLRLAALLAPYPPVTCCKAPSVLLRAF